MFDFIIVGARCAGASLATFLGKIGYSILLIDTFSYPGPTTSTHIIGDTDLYDRLGIRNDIESAGVPFLTRMRIDVEGRIFESDMYVTSRALGLRRELLDCFIFNRASNFNKVTTLLKTKVVDIIKSNNKVIGVTCLLSDGNRKDYFAKVVIGADGRNSTIANFVEAQVLKSTNNHHLGVYYSYVKNINPLSTPTVEWYWHREDIIICNPIDNELHCIAIMSKNLDFTYSNSLEKSFLDRLMEIQTLSSRFSNLTKTNKVKGIGIRSSFIKQAFGDGWALVGDANSYLHPVSGIGIDNAISMAEILSKELHYYMQGEKSWLEAMQNYTKLRDERVMPQYNMLQSTLSLTAKKIPFEALNTANMLCSFPSLAKKVILNVNEILKFINLREEN